MLACRWLRGRTACTYALAFSFLFSSVLFLGPVTSATPPQSDTTAEARQHYQNAVAAIGKNNWQTAKSELLAAEKLAPQNALVHYDLALAYSHTGQTAAAKTELNKALQLGLPPEQRSEAETLKQKLATQPVTAKGTSSSSRGASGHSVDEILAWLQKTINSNAGESTQWDVDPANHMTYKSSYSFEYEGVAVSLSQDVRVTTRLTYPTLSGENDKSVHTIITFSLDDLDPDKIGSQPEKDSPNILQVQLETRNSANKIKAKMAKSTQCGIEDYGECKGKKPGEVVRNEEESVGSVMSIPFDSALAPRVVNAFRDAVSQAGGKKSVKDIY